MLRCGILLLALLALPGCLEDRDAEASDGPIAMLDGASFDDGVAEGVVVVDFYADWCGPCKQMAPVIKRLAGSMEGVRFAKVDVDVSGDLARRFGVESIPYFVVFKDGEPAGNKVGAASEDDFRRWIESKL